MLAFLELFFPTMINFLPSLKIWPGLRNRRSRFMMTEQGNLCCLLSLAKMARNAIRNRPMSLTYFILLILILSHDMDEHLAVISSAAYLQVFTRDSVVSSFSKDAGVSPSTSMKIPLASSAKPDENGTLPNQPTPQQMRHQYHLLASIGSAVMTRNRQLFWVLSQ